MHDGVMAWVAAKRDAFGLRDARMLDVGSLNVNGSTRELFSGETVGIDLQAGPDVDIVMAAADLGERFGAESFGVVTCTEMLEHDPTPWLTLAAIAEVLSPGGVVLLSARGVASEHCPITDRPHAFGRHGFPDANDWWRYMEGALSMLCGLVGLEVIEEIEDEIAPGWFCAARKP